MVNIWSYEGYGNKIKITTLENESIIGYVVVVLGKDEWEDPDSDDSIVVRTDNNLHIGIDRKDILSIEDA